MAKKFPTKSNTQTNDEQLHEENDGKVKDDTDVNAIMPSLL